MESKDLRILMISSDRQILTAGSAVSERMKEYGGLVEELHIVLLSDSSHKLKDTTLDKNIWVYPTNSSFKWFRSSGAARLGKKIIFDKKFIRGKSIITTQDPFECGRAGLIVKNKWRIPLEVQLHTDPFSPYFSGFLNEIRKIIARKVIKYADNVRVVSPSLGDKISKEFSIKHQNISVLPIYVDKNRIENEKVSFDLHARFGWHFILLAVSRLSVEKNLPMALEVLEKLVTFFPNAGLVIVGSGPEESSLKLLVKSLKLENNVVFVGWQEDLGSYYKTANLFIQTSNFEGYGLSLVEAGISGLPIVTTNVGIANDLENGHDVYICPPGDVEYMFKAVYDLVENNSMRESLRMNIKRKLDSILITKEEYLEHLLKTWRETASHVN